MPLDRGWILAHIPHQGRMCLLDEVLDWDDEHVRCRSGAHRQSDNPLCAQGTLGSACGIEFAAQAMAVHGALIAAERQDEPRAGRLAGVRGVELFVSRLDDVAADLIATCERLAGDDRTVLYGFSISGGSCLLLRGRATIVLAPLPAPAATDAESRL